MTITSNTSTVTVEPTGTFDVKEFLKTVVPGTNHELLPHGASMHGWYRVATRCTWGTSGDAGCYIDRTQSNWWGVIYVDTSNYHAPNVRVLVHKDVKMLFSYEGSNQWTYGQHSTGDAINWRGAGWPESWSTDIPNTAINKKSEPGENISYIPRESYVSHFYPGPWVDITPGKRLHAIVIAHAKLVLDSATGPDNRALSKYIIGFGGDLRREGVVQKSYGMGKFIIATNNWRTVVLSTLSLNNLNTLTLPSATYFQQPDGTYPI